MAYYIATVLKLSPYEILNNWSAEQVYVAYGIYANQKAIEHYEIWKNSDVKTRGKEPKARAIYFGTKEMLK